MKFKKKSLGQNFLIDKNIIKKIVNTSEIFNKNVLEIGPGEGALTDQILKGKPKNLILIEKDNLLSLEIKKKYKDNKNVKVYNEDILECNLEKILKKDTLVFGNLPYNISSQILVKMVKFNNWPPKYSSLIFMFQKEMAERIMGNFGTSKYGRLSILTNYRLSIEYKFDVSPNCFLPKPKVDSTVLVLKPRKKIRFKINDIKNLENITNIIFSNKRKMINKSIKKIFKSTENINIISDLNLNSRPSDLNPDLYYQMTKLYEKT